MAPWAAGLLDGPRSRARRSFASLVVPPFRRFLLGNIASLVGFWMRVVIQGWLVYDLTQSRTMLGTVTLVGLLPFVFLSPFGGVLADRVDRRRWLMTLPLVAVAANAVLGVLVITKEIAIGHILATAVLIGVARAIEIPFRNAFVRDVVGLEMLPNAVALNAAAFNVARVAGPAIGAGLLYLIGMGPCFLVAAAANATMIFVLVGMRVTSTQTKSAARGPFRQVAEGLRYVRGHRRTRTLMVLLAITLLSTWAYQTLMPAFARDQLGMEEGGYMLLMATAGLGALLGALWVAGRSDVGGSRRNQVFGLVWTGAACVFLLGFVEHVALALPLLVAVGFAQVGFIATANGMVQESVPDELRGRVMGLWTFVFGSCFPLGAQLMGFVSEHFDIRTAWSGGATLMVLLSAVVWWRLPPRGPRLVEATGRAPWSGGGSAEKRGSGA